LRSTVVLVLPVTLPRERLARRRQEPQTRVQTIERCHREPVYVLLRRANAEVVLVHVVAVRVDVERGDHLGVRSGAKQGVMEAADAAVELDRAKVPGRGVVVDPRALGGTGRRLTRAFLSAAGHRRVVRTRLQDPL
jgi:hypothetical protein